MLVPLQKAAPDPMSTAVPAPAAASGTGHLDSPGPGSPVSSTHVAIWFGQQQVPDSTAYQCAERIDIRGDLDPAVFGSVLARCLSAIPALNARYVPGPTGPRRVPVHREHPLPVIDVRETDDPSAAGDAVVAELMAMPAAGDAPADRVIADAWLSDQRLVRLSDSHHVWLQRIHHLCVDGYSFAVLLRWVAACYSATVRGEPTPEVPFADSPSADSPPAADDADASQDAPARDDPDAHFWREYCASRDRPPSLTSRPPSAGAQRAHRVTGRLAPRTLTDGRGWAETSMAAAGIYVASLSAERDVVLGMPWANRRMGRRPCIEPTVNILPLHVRPIPTTTVGDLIAGIGAEVRVVRPHVSYGADRLRRDLGAVGTDTPLYGPVVNVKFFTPELAFGTAVGTVSNIAMGPVDDVTLTVSPQPDGGVVLEVETNPQCYDAATTARHAQRIVALLDTLSTAPSTTPIGALRIADGADVDAQILRHNDTRHPLPDVTLTELLTLSTLDNRDRTALRWANGSLGYTELFAAANDLRETLHDVGAGPGTVVALRMTRSPEMVIAIVATILAGAAYLPIDPAQPEARIEAILDDAAPVAELSLAGDGEKDWGWEGLAVSVIPGPGAREPRIRDIAPHPRDAAYVIFTSGSTGRPKGVVIEHRAIVNRLRWMDDTFQLGPDDRVLQKTPYSFDVSVWEFFWPLLTGAELVLAAPGSERDSHRIAAELVDNAITVCHFVPSAFAAFLGEPGARNAPSLRLVICSGEALPVETLAVADDVLGAGKVHNLYGPTEAAVDITWWRPDGAEYPVSVPIGLPVYNSAVYVLDDALRPLPLGSVGELHLAGIQLARGYLGQPGLTATRFVADPFRPGARMYASGDLARRRPDGEIEYVGRVDDQVKVRGRRIELGEINAALASVPGVAQAVTVTRGHASDTLLLAYVVAAPGQTVSPVAARAALAHTLPGYLLPDAIEIIDELPITVNGKLDRRRLPEPTLGNREITAPTSPLEMSMATVFAEVLGRPEISVSDSFFDLGGNSLSATRLAARAGETLGREVTVSDVFAAPSVIALARRLAGDASVDPFGRLLTLRSDGDREPLFCIHPAGGLGWCYAGLLGPLDRTIPVHLLQADGFHGETLPTSLRAVAEDYLSAIDSVTPRGPIRLLGWSVGGVIAHEIAVLAQARGRVVAGLCLLDAHPGELWRDQPPPDPATIRRAFGIMAGVDGTPLDSDEAVLAALRTAHSPFGGLTTTQVRAITEIVAHFATLMREHTTSVFDGDAVLFRATEGAEDFLDPSAWSNHLTGSLRRIDVPTTHPGMVHPETLELIAAELDRMPTRDDGDRE